ncbi:MAG: bifunctional chorismate mutase/prephenate dehydratase [Oscillospiraceae bacterium]
MTELEGLRLQIDAIDREIVPLFEQRMVLASRVAEYKAAHGLQTLDASREQQVLAEKRALLEDKTLEPEVTELYETLMALSRRRQQQLRDGKAPGLQEFLDGARSPVENPCVLYQGEPGAYAEEATAQFFGEHCRRQHRDTWEELLAALENGEGDYAVLPIENSSSGGITAVYDLLAKSGASMVGEQSLKVEHCLMAMKGATLADLRTVYSHEQGILQSAAFLKEHGFHAVPRLNTAESAKFVAESGDKTIAAIGSVRAAKLYGLEILAEKINFNSDNFTRFVVVSPRPELRENSDKISALATLPHRSGSLNRLMNVFSAYGLNVLKLESRPIIGSSWQYRFFLDFSGNLRDPSMATALAELSEAATEFRILGSYPSGVTG